jgi:hypothetical protein
MLAALVRGGREWYLPEQAPKITCHWQGWQEDLSMPDGEYLDLSHTPGLRVWMQEADGQIRWTCQFHHACCDGVGAFRFLGDWLAAYEAESRGGQAEPKWQPIDAEVLRHRGRPRWFTSTEPVSRWQVARSWIREATHWLSRKPAPLRAEGESQANIGPYPGLQHRVFSAETTKRLLLHAKTLGVSLNDWLLCGLFQTLAEWNCPDNLGRGRRWLVVNMPTNLRLPNDKAMSAANAIGYAFLTRREGECHDGSALLESLSQETRAIVNWNLGQYFLDALVIGERLPGIVRWFTARPRPFATTVFSNIGDIARRFRVRLPRQNGKLRAGDLVLESFLGIPPLRPGTRAAFLASIYGGQLSLCLRRDPQHLDEAASGRLLESFVGRVEGRGQRSEVRGQRLEKRAESRDSR